MNEIKPRTPAEIIDVLIAMKECGLREIAFDWRDIVLGNVSKRTMIKACRRYGKVRRRIHGFSIRF